MKTNKMVLDELAARQMYARLEAGFATANPQQKADLAAYCNSITQTYPATPTGIKAAELTRQLATPGK